jgi:hypothetical protein
MSDVTDLYKALRAHRRERSRTLCEDNIATLRKEEIAYQVCNPAIPHLLVAGRFDFWPSTGKWNLRGRVLKGYGVDTLIEEIRPKRTTNGETND